MAECRQTTARVNHVGRSANSCEMSRYLALPQLLGLPRPVRACLLDLDGVLTETARVSTRRPPSSLISFWCVRCGFELWAERGESWRSGEGVEEGVGASPVSLDREVSGLVDFGGASAEDECPESGAGQLD